MTVTQMSATQITRFITYVEMQGVVTTRTKKGILCRFSDGDTYMIHFTVSDHRAAQNIWANFRRHGVFHPDDPKASSTLPSYVTSGGISKKTRDAVIDVLVRMGYPQYLTTNDLKPMDSPTASRGLYHMGFTPQFFKDKKPHKRKWLTPAELLKPAQNSEPDTEPETEPNEVELLTEVDSDEAKEPVKSWAVSIQDIPETISVRDYMQSLLSAGLQGEIRVWRQEKTD